MAPSFVETALPIVSWLSFGFQPPPGLRLEGRPGGRGPATARGKSGHRRAGRWGNPRRRKPTESGTERRPPPATSSPETPAVRVKRWGKSPPASWRHGGWPNPVRCKAKQAPHKVARRGAGYAASERWSPKTESGSQACYGKPSQTRGFSI